MSGVAVAIAAICAGGFSGLVTVLYTGSYGLGLVAFQLFGTIIALIGAYLLLKDSQED